MEIDIITLAKECPNLTISVKGSDLIEANNKLLQESERRLRDIIKTEEKSVFLTREQVMTKLNVVASTLWRWKQSSYLVPVNVGGQYRYKSSDIDEILEGKR